MQLLYEFMQLMSSLYNFGVGRDGLPEMCDDVEI